MTTVAGFLARPGASGSEECRTVLRQLALLWKFGLHEHDAPGGQDFSRVDGPIFVDMSGSDPGYEKHVLDVMEALPHVVCVLLLNDVLEIGNERLRSMAGFECVSESVWQGDMPVTRAAEDVLLVGVDETTALRDFRGRVIWNIGAGDARPLLQSEGGVCFMARHDRVYSLSLPVWQFGVVSYPPWFRIIENAVFFSRGQVHMAPGPYVAFRIDDVPITGESLIKQGYSDSVALGEIREIQKAELKFGAKIEYMLSSHILDAGGVVKPAEAVADRSLERIKALWKEGRINLGAHGYLHLDAAKYNADRTLFPREFLTMDEVTTGTAFARVSGWVNESFGKQNMGFVAPAWGYKAGVTKRLACGVFRYVADSNQHLQEGLQPDVFGTVTNGCVSMYETWRSGMSGICMADKEVFSGFLQGGLPVHLMLHGALVDDPLKASHKIWIVLLGAIACGLLLVAAWAWFGGYGIAAIFSLLLLSFASLYYGRRYIGWLIRHALARLGRKLRAVDLAREGIRAGARYIYVEELADHMESYAQLSIQTSRLDDGRFSIHIECGRQTASPVSLHFPAEITNTVAKPENLILEQQGSLMRIGPIDIGAYDLTVGVLD